MLSSLGKIVAGCTTLAGLGFYYSGDSITLKVLAGLAAYFALACAAMTFFTISKQDKDQVVKEIDSALEGHHEQI